MYLRSIELTPAQCRDLKDGYENGKSSAYRKRCHLVLLKQEGRTSKDVGKIVGLHQVSVNNWLDRYEAEGTAGLKTRPGRGRKPILDGLADAQKVKDVVKKERQRLKRAKAVLEKDMGKSFCTMTLKRFLKNVVTT
jgi:transposase